MTAMRSGGSVSRAKLPKGKCGICVGVGGKASGLGRILGHMMMYI